MSVRGHRRSARRLPRAALILAGFSGLALTAAVLVSPSASAEAASLGVTQYSVGGSQIQFSICLTADYDGTDQALPAHLDGTYTVSLGGSVVQSGDWSDPDPNATLLYTEPCPSVFITLAVNDLQPSQTYTINVRATLSPKAENDDGDYVDDTSRSTVVLSSSLLASTSDGLSPGDGSGGDPGDDSGGGSTGEGSTGEGSTGAGSTGGGSTGDGTGPGASGGHTGSTGGSGSAVPAPVMIANPATFTSTQLVALTPAQVATIAPETFGQLPPAIFRGLTAGQAAALTGAQVSSIRPARAAELRPAAVAALPAAAIAALRPAAVKFLSPQAVAALTPAQLRALTPRQIVALRPLQLAVLSPAQKALLRGQ